MGGFSIEAVIHIGLQMTLHSKRIVYCDVKADNVLTQRGYPETDVQMGDAQLHLVDFASSRLWDPEARGKSKRRTSKRVGTSKYASVNAHKGVDLTPRDDLESVGFMLVDLAKGALPWSGVLQKNWKRIAELKEETLLVELFDGLPAPLMRYMCHVQNLRARTPIDYDFLRNLLRESLAPNVEIVQAVADHEKGKARKIRNANWRVADVPPSESASGSSAAGSGLYSDQDEEG
ncbi:casein kinase I [Borealophlyctis nickersoniae]|nr:casein kinase I [Borealophlyctis nickersoniae]